MTLRSTLPPGLGGGSVCGFPLPIARGFPLLFFLAVCLVRAMQRETYTLLLYGNRSNRAKSAPVLYETADHMTN